MKDVGIYKEEEECVLGKLALAGPSGMGLPRTRAIGGDVLAREDDEIVD